MPLVIEKVLPMSPVHLLPMSPVYTPFSKGDSFPWAPNPSLEKRLSMRLVKYTPIFFSGRLAHVLPGYVS
jgi:hypothetical protein